MKKIYLLSAMAAGLLAFASCSNDDIAATTGNGNNELGFGESELTIGITNTATRAARPIGSSAAANNVNKVTLKLFTINEGAYSDATGVSIKGDGDLTIDWTAGPDGEGPSTTDREGKKTITLTGLQPNTTYQIVAYGYNGTEPTVTNVGGVCSISPTSVEEVFAGEIGTVITDGNGKFSTTQSITMERQIAGMLGYFTNVPTHIGTDVVAKLVVYANAKTTGYNFNWESSSLNGLGQTTAKTALLTFDMSQIATNWKSGAPTDDTYTFNSHTASSQDTPKPFAKGYTAPADLVLKDGSIFGATFILPYASHVESQTLTVVLEDADGAALKTMNVITDKTNESVTDYKHQYDIRRNNFYSIGQKLYADNDQGDPNPDDEEDPKPGDEDDPIDVSASNDIILILNDAWEVLHNMGIE